MTRRHTRASFPGVKGGREAAGERPGPGGELPQPVDSVSPSVTSGATGASRPWVQAVVSEIRVIDQAGGAVANRARAAVSPDYYRAPREINEGKNRSAKVSSDQPTL
jgi:hypothetical protein